MPQQGEPTVALWIRNQSHAQGREVKIYLPEDSHVADIAEKAAGLFRFNGATRSHVDLYVSKADGNQLPMMMPISELEKGQVSVIGVNPENDESAEDALWGRSKSWTGAAQTKRQDTATPTLFRKSDTSYGYDFEAADDDAASVAGRSTASSVKSGGEERARRRRERTAQFADQIEADDDFHAGASWTASDLLDAGDAGEGGLPKRVRTRTWHAADEKDGGLQNPFDGMPKRAVTCELIGADEDEPEGSTRGAEPGRPEVGKRSRSAGRSNPVKPGSARNSRVTFYEPFAKQGTPATAAAGDPGAATGAYTPDLHSRIVKAMEQDIFAGTNDVFANKDAPWNKGQDAMPRRPAPAPLIGKSSPAVYVDRIPPDTSDAMIRTAIDSHLEPAGVKKVVSLEVSCSSLFSSHFTNIQHTTTGHPKPEDTPLPRVCLPDTASQRSLQHLCCMPLHTPPPSPAHTHAHTHTCHSPLNSSWCRLRAALAARNTSASSPPTRPGRCPANRLRDRLCTSECTRVAKVGPP